MRPLPTIPCQQTQYLQTKLNCVCVCLCVECIWCVDVVDSMEKVDGLVREFKALFLPQTNYYIQNKRKILQLYTRSGANIKRNFCTLHYLRFSCAANNQIQKYFKHLENCVRVQILIELESPMSGMSSYAVWCAQREKM